MTRIINRKGEIESLDFSQIKNVISIAFEGITEINKLELEAEFTRKNYRELKTKEIQKELVRIAVRKIHDHPQWDIVASRLLLWDIYKDYEVNRNRKPYSDYYQDVVDLVGENHYLASIFDIYSKTELQEAGKWIKQSYERFLPYSSVLLMQQRYMVSANELPQNVYLTCALLLAQNEADRLSVAKQIYEAIANRYISLATPILANLRTVRSQSLTSCFIATIEDTIESIFDNLKNISLISKNGGGVGINISKIRANGSDLMGKPNQSNGIMPWVRIVNDTAVAVNQGGKRKGAVTVALDVWHADIEKFLECQLEEGDLRLKAFDMFPQIVIPDEFMRRLPIDGDWTIVCPHEVKRKFGYDLPELWGEDFTKAYLDVEAKKEQLDVVKVIKAKNLVKKAMQTQHETGLPYIAFKDTINRANPNKHDGYIPSVNLCVESFSNVKADSTIHCCNLVSLNLARINTRSESIENITALAVRILDNTIDITLPPVSEAKEHNNRYRTIGIGCMGLADWLAKNNLRYENTQEIGDLIEKIAYYTVQASLNLAKQRGAYPMFEGSDWSKGIYNGYTKESLEAKGKYKWIELLSEIQQHGIRNSHLLAIAPNTSSSLIQGCTASILPIFDKQFLDHAGKRAIPITPPYPIAQYQLNRKTKQNVIINAVSAMQQWIDTGISMELIFDMNPNAYGRGETLKTKDIYDNILLAHRLNIKTIYYIRKAQKSLHTEIICDCSN